MTPMNKPLRKENYSYLAFLAFCGFLTFIVNPTAYTWGEQDMMPFLERVFNPEFLTNDFFTNSSALRNPRWVYGYLIVAPSWITGISWYTTLYVGKLLLLTILPIFHFKVIRVLLNRYVNTSILNRLEPFVFIAVVLMTVWAGYRDFFAIAGWRGYNPFLTPMNVSLLCCFVGILFRETNQRSLFYLGFFFLSCAIHPAMGLFGMVFYIIFIIPSIKVEALSVVKIVIAGIIAIVLVRFFLVSSETLSAAEFIQYYALERHPWHYHVPEYTHQMGNWKHYFLLINLLFLIPLGYGIFRKRKELWITALVAWLSYVLSIFFQYFFIDIYPLKIMAYLGPSRNTTFGYWSLVILWSLMFSYEMKKDNKWSFPSIKLSSFLVILFNLLIIGLLYLDNPKELNTKFKKDFYSFVTSTPENSIFVAYSVDINTDLRIIGERAVTVGKEFPFAESEIKEFHARYTSLYGSQQKGMNWVEHFRTLKPKDFLSVSKKYGLDYVILEREFAINFKENVPVWTNNKLYIYSVEDLKP